MRDVGIWAVFHLSQWRGQEEQPALERGWADEAVHPLRNLYRINLISAGLFGRQIAGLADAIEVEASG
jgi:hypothetical protein